MYAENDSHTKDALSVSRIIIPAWAITPQCFVKDVARQFQRICVQLWARVEAAVRSTGGLNRHRIERLDAKGPEAYQSSDGYCPCSRLSAKRFKKGSESRRCEYHEEVGKVHKGGNVSRDVYLCAASCLASSLLELEELELASSRSMVHGGLSPNFMYVPCHAALHSLVSMKHSVLAH